jgi:uncharacterized protein HemY
MDYAYFSSSLTSLFVFLIVLSIILLTLRFQLNLVMNIDNVPWRRNTEIQHN